MKPPPVRIAVVGSLNVDWIAQVPHLPKAGQTVASTKLLQRFGGKGANQAIAAARQGAHVSMIGSVGADASGLDYRTYLQQQGIDDTGIITLPKTFTGNAMIAVDVSAENMIIVNAGANGKLTPAHIRHQASLIASAKVLLLQFEVPLPSVVEALRLAEQSRVPVVLNPSPTLPDFPWGKHPIHTLIVNEGETRSIFGKRTIDKPASLRKALTSHRINRLIITRGSESTLAILGNAQIEMPAMQVTPLDTIGAGDAFAGAYATCLAQKHELPYCLQYANTAGALATLNSGAQEAIPTRLQVQRAMKRK